MADAAGRGGDPMKYYCIVFGLLVIVIAFVYFHLNGELEAYAKANKQADDFLTGKGVRVVPGRRDQPPPKLGDLSVEVIRFVNHLRQAGGAAEGGIEMTMINQAAEATNVNINASREKDDPNSKGFKTISRKLTVAPTTLQNLFSFAYNIEHKGRYRVFDMVWSLLDEKSNSTPPRNRIGKSTLTVGYREAWSPRGRQ